MLHAMQCYFIFVATLCSVSDSAWYFHFCGKFMISFEQREEKKNIKKKLLLKLWNIQLQAINVRFKTETFFLCGNTASMELTNQIEKENQK